MRRSTRDRRRRPARSARPTTRAASRCRACSIPVERHVARDARGAGRRRRATLRLELEGLAARVVQHELDHLDGVLILDRTTPEARREALARRCGRSRSLGPVVRASRVAATAPFGADVLERLAARHEIALLLTRPDRPRGPRPTGRRRRRRRRRPSGSGIPVRQPERLDAALDLGGRRSSSSPPTALLIPEPAARAGALAERPPVAAAALARRGAGRARDHGRRRGDRRDDPRDGRGARRRADRGAAARSRSGPRTTPAPSSSGPAELAAELLERGAAGAARSCRSPTRASPTPRRSAPDDRELDWSRPPRSCVRPGPRALAAHRRARRAARPPGDDLAGAGRGRRARARSRCSRTGGRRMTLRRVPARPRDERLARPPRGVRRRCCASSRTRPTPTGLRARRPSGLDDATGRSRSSSPTAPCSACARSTTRSRRSAAGRCASSTRRCARRCGSAPTSSRFLDGVAAHAAVNESVELVRARRPRARGRRSRTRSCGGSRRACASCVEALPDATRRRRRSGTPTRTGSPRPGGATSGADDALALMRAQNEPPETVVRLVRGRGPVDGEPTRRPGRAARRARRRARRSPRGASGRRAAARSSPALAVGVAARASACSTSAPRRAARRRCSPGEVVAVEVHEGRARELEENVAPARRRRTSASSTPTGSRCPPELDGLRPGARRRARARGSACSPPGPTCAGARSRCPSSSSTLLRAAAERVRPGGDDRLLGLHDQRGRERGGRRRARARASSRPRRGVAAVPRTRAGPSSCSTLPHVHGTSGFFVARLRGRKIGAVALARLDRGRSRSSRRSTRPTSRGSASRSRRCCDAGARDLPLRRRRRALRPAGHDRAGRAALDRAADPRGRRRARLPPDGRRPRSTTSRRSPRPAATASPSTSRPSGRRRRVVARARASTGSGSASRSTRRPTVEDGGRGVASGADLVLCMSIQPGLLGPGVHAGGARRGSRELRALLPPSVPIQVDGGVGAGRTSARVRDAGATLLVAGSGDLRRATTSPRPTGGSSQRAAR